MAVNFSPWKPMTPALIAEAPNCPAVYELGTLVRTVVFIGAADGDLHQTLNQHLSVPQTLHPHLGRLYFRFAPHDEPEGTRAVLLEEFRTSHAGALPVAQQNQPTPMPVVEPRRHLKAVS
jgi:hypothetical protein